MLTVTYNDIPMRQFIGAFQLRLPKKHGPRRGPRVAWPLLNKQRKAPAPETLPRLENTGRGCFSRKLVFSSLDHEKAEYTFSW
jgi:hypothetical protein